MKRKGMGPQELANKLMLLKEENDMLRKNNLSIKEVEVLISENKKMKQEL